MEYGCYTNMNEYLSDNWFSMKKTSKVLEALKYIADLDLSSLEIERLISELEDIQEWKEVEEWDRFLEDEEDKKISLDLMNGYFK